MATIVLRAGKGSPLTNAEVDANFTNLNTEVAAAATTASWSGVTGKPATLAGYGITDAQPVDADLTAIAALAGTSGFLKKTAANTWALDTATYLTGINSSQVTTALGFTPYNATNPSGYITASASITGNAATATALQTARTIGGVSFNGTANINLPGVNATGNQNTTGTAAGLTDNSSWMLRRGSVAAASIDTATANGFYNQTNVGDSQGVLVFNAGGSLGPLQMTFTYGGLMQFRGKTDSAAWTAWKTVLTSANFGSYAPSLTGAGASGTWGISISGSAATLTTGRTIALTGDVTYTSGSFNGSANVTGTATLAASGVTAGTYGSSTNIPQLTVDAKGRVTAVSNVAVSIPSGSLTFTEDVTGTGTTGSSTALTLAASGVTAGTYRSVTVDAKGRVTAGSNPTTLSGYGITDAINVSQKAVANGVATLDDAGLVPASQLPSYVDDVLEYANLAGFPATGQTGKIYVALDTNKTYRWGGTVYIYITSGAVDSVAGKTGVVTLVKSDVGLGSVDNTADAAKGVLSATKLTTARTIGGVSFDGTANINLPGVNAAGNQSTTGNAATATTLQTARTLTIGSTGKTFNGSANVTWSLAEIGALGASAKAADSELLDGYNSDRFLRTYADSSMEAGVHGGNLNGTNMQYLLAREQVQNHLAFRAPTSYETWNGTSWVSQTVPTAIFSNKPSSGFGGLTVANGVTKVRFTWLSFGYKFWSTLATAGSTNGNSFRARIYTSSDNVTWVERFVSGYVTDWPGYHVWPTYYGDAAFPHMRIELEFTWNNANACSFGDIALHGAYGGYTPLFDWDYNRNITLGGDLQQNNATYLKGKLASGSSTRLFGLNSVDTLYIGSIDTDHTGGTLFVKNGITQMSISSSGVVNVVGSVTTGGTISATGSISTASAMYVTGQTVLHAGNYGSYTMPLNGGSTWNMSYFDFNQSNTYLRITSGPGTFHIGDDDAVNLANSALVATPSSRVTSGVALLSTYAYGVSQGDNRTHLGYYNGAGYVNYIRGAATYFDSGTLQIAGNQALHAGNYTSYAPSLSGSYINMNVGGLYSRYSYQGETISDATTAYTLSPNFGTTTVAMHGSHGDFGSWATTLTMSGYERYGAYQISGNYNASTPALSMRNYNQSIGGWTSWTRLLSAANFSSYALPLSGGTLIGRLVSSDAMTAWSQSIPGTGLGNYHIGSASGVTNAGGAITFGSRDHNNGLAADAGIYVNSDGAYGTKMFLATTDSYALGSKNAVSIDHLGHVTVLRGNLSSVGSVTSGGNTGFRNDVYYGSVRNPIWSFGNATAYGISYFQGSAGIGGADVIGIHPNGTPTATGSSFAVGTSNSYVNNNVVLHAGNYSSYGITRTTGSPAYYGARAWVNFNGNFSVTQAPLIRASQNVSSITDNGVGDYTVNFTTAMPDANYAVVFSNNDGNAAQPGRNTGTISSYATSNVRVISSLYQDTKYDTQFSNVVIFR